MVETKVAKLKVKIEIEEAERCHAMVESEALKVKAKMEIENAARHKEIEIEEINYQAMKNNFKTIIACTWIFIMVYLFMAGSASKGVFDCRCDRILLP